MKRTRINKRAIIMIGIPFILLALLAVGYFSGFLFFSGMPPCLPPPGTMVDGMAEANIFTWVDLNQNGRVDPGEPPLPRVAAIHPHNHPEAAASFTDLSGRLQTNEFKPGCACKCWQSSYVEVAVPTGYEATTPVRQVLAGPGLTYSFGFIKTTP